MITFPRLAGLLAAVALTACGGAQGTDTPSPTDNPDGATATEAAATGEPIVVGAVSSLTGPATFPESTAAAQAVFDRVNAEGGIQGRPIEYVVEDDGFDPGTASQAARRLVEAEGAVVLAGSASLLECGVNASYYQSQGIYSIQGTGIDPGCFTSSNISPVNTGPFLSNTVALFYASETLGAETVCFGAFDIPNYQEAYDHAIAEWTAVTSRELTYRDTTLALDGDLTPFMLALEDNGCDAAVVQANDFHYVSMMRIRESQGLDVQIVGLTSGYTRDVAEELGTTGNGLILASEFEPYTNAESPALEDWRELMAAAEVPETSFAEGGYLAAQVLVDVLRGIEGQVTRESVTEALNALDSYESPLIGSPYAFGDAPQHSSNRSAKFVELQDGEWVVRSDDWVTLPEA